MRTKLDIYIFIYLRFLIWTTENTKYSTSL